MDQLNMALMMFDTRGILIPQGAVATIEMISSLEPDDGHTGAIGRLRSGGREWPVFALDRNLAPIGEAAPTSKYCVAFDIDGETAFALVCDEVSSMALASTDEINPLQACMRNAASPIEAMVMREGQLLLLSRVETMHRYLDVDVAA